MLDPMRFLLISLTPSHNGGYYLRRLGTQSVPKDADEIIPSTQGGLHETILRMGNEVSTELPLTIGDRVFRVLESGLLQTLLGIVGGLSGTFLDGRYFLILTPLVPSAIHRSKALDGVERPAPAVTYALSVLVTAGLLYWCGVSLNHSRTGTFTPQDYAQAVSKVIPETRISTEEVISPPRQTVSPSTPPQPTAPQLVNPNLLGGSVEQRAWDVSPRQVFDLSKSLMGYQMQNNFRVPLSISYLLGNRESFLFAEDVQMAFRNGGWAAQLNPRTDISYIDGLVVIQSSVELQPPGAKELRKFAKDTSVHIEVEEDPARFKRDEFEVLVGKARRVDPVTPQR